MELVDLDKFRKRKIQILDFLQKYRNTMYREEFLYYTFLLKSDEIPTSALIFEVLSRFNVLYEEKDIYKRFARLLEKYHFLDGNVCEVGAGSFAPVSHIISPLLEEKGHSLIIYEPKLVFEKIKNMRLIKDQFTKDTNIKDVDTLPL